MLTESPTIKPALVRGHFETLKRFTIPNGVETTSRFTAVVDEYGTELGAVSDRYKLIQTADIVAAFDLEAKRLGYKMSPRSGFYCNGRAKVILDVVNRTMRRDGGDGDITPMVYIKNGLGGVSNLQIGTGANIRVCDNGMWFGDVVSKDTRKHTTGLDLGAIVSSAMLKLDARIERDMAYVEAARGARFDFTGDLMRKIGEDAPKRLVPEFKRIITTNRQRYGDTAWALVQAVTELSTHHMRERRDGSHVWTADEWTTRQLRAVNEELALVR